MSLQPLRLASLARALAAALLASAAAATVAQAEAYKIEGVRYGSSGDTDTYNCVTGRVGSSNVGRDRIILPVSTRADAQRECAQSCSRDTRCRGFNLVNEGLPEFPEIPGHVAYYCDRLYSVDTTKSHGTTGTSPGSATTAICYRRLRVAYSLPPGTPFPQDAANSDIPGTLRYQQDLYRPGAGMPGSPGGGQRKGP